MALTKKMQLFVKAFCSDPNIGKAEAAKRAGYKADRAAISACELLKNVEIQREIERQLTKKITRLPLTKESVLDDLRDIDEMCRQAGAGSWQVATRVKIAELLGRHLKMFTDKIEVGLDDKLMERLEAGRKRAGLEPPKLPEPPQDAGPEIEGGGAIQ